MEGQIGHYRVVAELGRGGMGVVYKAHEESLNRFVAIKVLGEHLTQDKTYVSRFVREARAAAALNHPNIIQIYFIGEDEGRHYFVMEYVKGRSVHQILRDEGRLPPVRAAQIVQQAASGLAAAHRQGVIHRDIKPANLMINEQGLVKIADFGLALQPDEGTRLTASGMLVGTPGYLSPEQCLGSELDARTDIYSLGMTYYEMLTGTMPFKADSPFAIVRQIVEAEPPEVNEVNPEVDADTAAILRRMIAKEPKQRYQTCDELLAHLAAYLESSAPFPAEGHAVAPGVAPAAEDPQELSMPVASAPGSDPTTAGAPAVAAAETLPMADAATRPVPPRSKRLPLFLVAGAALVLLVAAGLTAAFVFGPKVVGLLKSGSETLAAHTLSTPETAGTELASEAGGTEERETTVESTPIESQQLVVSGDRDADLAGTDSRESDSRQSDPSAADYRSEPKTEVPASAVVESEPRPSAMAAESTWQAPAVPAPPPPEQPAVTLPLTPAVAVIGVGERLLAVAAESQIEEELLSYGLEVVDEGSSPRLNDLLASGQGAPYLEDLLFLLHQEGVDVLVLARAEFLSERELYYLGRADIAYTSQLHITSFLVREESGVGAGWSERIEYTALNTERQVQSFLDKMGSDLADAIQSTWAAYRQRVMARR